MVWIKITESVDQKVFFRLSGNMTIHVKTLLAMTLLIMTLLIMTLLIMSYLP
jgi:hypothetical protein